VVVVRASRPTSADVARLAKVSQATVSYVLNNTEGQHGLLFGQDHVQGKPFVAFTLMHRAWRAQPHPQVVDRVLEDCARGALRNRPAVARRRARPGPPG
jgi:hypothetical protein